MSQLSTKQKLENSYDIYEILNKNCMDYARYVLKYRCIPDLVDGLKPIHRRSIWSFYNNKLTHNKPRAKSVNACGGVLAYSPHGDASVYGACVRLANDSVNINLIDGKGSFSSTTSRDVNAGASRYTEMRLSKICDELLNGIDKNNVDMVKTYDEARLEPVVLPAMFPLILCNPTIGIGVGISTNIASFNIKEVIDYTLDIINGITPKLLSPDFPTGGNYIYSDKELKSIDENGRGSLAVMASYKFEDNAIVFTQIPYTTTREQIVEKIISVVKEGKIKEIIDVNDYTGVKGLDITVDLKKGSNKDRVLSLLFKHTPLQDTFSCNFNVLDNGIPKLLGVKDIISKWLIFRKQCLKRELEYDITQLQQEQNKLLGLQSILNDLDKAISIIRSSKTESEAMTKLSQHFNLNQDQCEYISTIKMVNMNNEWLTKRINKLTEVNSQLKVNQSNLSSDTYYNQTIISQLEYIKKTYGQARKTSIIHEDAVEAIKQDDLVENYNCNIVLSQQGYIKKTLRCSYSHKTKDGDSIIQQISSTNKSKLLLFSDKGVCYYLNCHEIDQSQPSNLGTYLPSLLQLQDENIIYVASTEDFKGYMLFAFENGKVAKIDMSSYETKTNRTKCINAYNTSDKLVSINYIEKDCDYMAVSSIDKVLVFNTSQINSKASKNSMGVNALRSKQGSFMLEFKPCDIDNPDYYRANIPAVGCFRK